MIDMHYTDSRLAQIYDLENKWADDTDFYLSLTKDKALRILDIGCGTGLLTRAFAEQGNMVTGVEPAEAMLEIARSKDTEKVSWVLATGQDYNEDKQFDLAVMTGHTFQTLVGESDAKDVLTNIYNHLEIGGSLVFESRNPLIDWKSKWSERPDAKIELSGEEIKVVTDEISVNNDIISFSHHYHFPDDILTSTSNLRFMSAEKIKSLLTEAGFEVENIFGYWDRSNYESDSLEMIFTARKNV